jgi:hypothetical protein
MNRKQLQNQIGEYVETGIKLVGIGRKYAYYYSIWDDGTGKSSGYCRREIGGEYAELEFIPASRAIIA